MIEMRQNGALNKEFHCRMERRKQSAPVTDEFAWRALESLKLFHAEKMLSFRILNNSQKLLSTKEATRAFVPFSGNYVATIFIVGLYSIAPSRPEKLNRI